MTDIPEWFNQDQLDEHLKAITEVLASDSFLWQLTELEGTQVAVGCHHQADPDGYVSVYPLFALLMDGDLIQRITVPDGAEPLGSLTNMETKESDGPSP